MEKVSVVRTRSFDVPLLLQMWNILLQGLDESNMLSSVHYPVGYATNLRQSMVCRVLFAVVTRTSYN
jgi:hypothetical protein